MWLILTLFCRELAEEIKSGWLLHAGHFHIRHGTLISDYSRRDIRNVVDNLWTVAPQITRLESVLLFVANAGKHGRRKNQWMTQVKMFIHFRLTQHVLGIIMPIVRTDCIKPRVVLAWMCWLR